MIAQKHSEGEIQLAPSGHRPLAHGTQQLKEASTSESVVSTISACSKEPSPQLSTELLVSEAATLRCLPHQPQKQNKFNSKTNMSGGANGLRLPPSIL